MWSFQFLEGTDFSRFDNEGSIIFDNDSIASPLHASLGKLLLATNTHTHKQAASQQKVTDKTMNWLVLDESIHQT